MARLPKAHKGDDVGSALNSQRTGSREKLLETAIEVFANIGYNAAGARQLTDTAGTNLGAINYHFGSKEGLYCAALDHIASKVLKIMEPTNNRLANSVSDEDSADKLLNLALSFMEDWVDIVLGIKLVGWRSSYSLLFARCEFEQPTQTATLFNELMEKLCYRFIPLIARIQKLPPDDAEVRMLVSTLLAQPVILRPRADGCSIGLVREKVDQRFRDAVQSRIRANTAAILKAGIHHQLAVVLPRVDGHP
jgi:AcrR family transcriptional regulator